MDKSIITLEWTPEGYLPNTVDKRKWKSYTPSSAPIILMHDCMAHTPNESGTSWEEARALGATIYLRNKKLRFNQRLVKDTEQEGTWIDAPSTDGFWTIRKNIVMQFDRLTTSYRKQWIDWIMLGYASAYSGIYTPQMMSRNLNIRFDKLHSENEDSNIQFDLINGTYEIEAKEDAQNRILRMWGH